MKHTIYALTMFALAACTSPQEEAIGRFNLRSSNTEPVVRLNVESRGDVPLMEARTRTLLALLNE